jgi:hypothetical protein
MNKQLFYGQYKRIVSYFEGTELAATGLPTGKELELLETVRDKVPPEVFEKAYSNPVNGNPTELRSHLLEAIWLFKAAGYEVRNQRLVDSKTGEPYAIEFLSDDPSFERVFLFYQPSLERLGINVTVRTVDVSQYENRLRTWDFDIITATWGETLSPGNEQRGYWGSQGADQPGSRNLIGIKNPAVDAMINEIIFAKNRSDLEAATRALDRILLWNHYVVPQWTYGQVRSARWDRFGHPDPMPRYGGAAFPAVWWWDAEKAAKAVLLLSAICVRSISSDNCYYRLSVQCRVWFRVTPLIDQQTSTILPAEPGSRISLCARVASASGNTLPTTGRKVPFSRPAKSPAWMSASSAAVMAQSVNARIEARRAISSRGLMVTSPRLPITMTRPLLAKSLVSFERFTLASISRMMSTPRLSVACRISS